MTTDTQTKKPTTALTIWRAKVTDALTIADLPKGATFLSAKEGTTAGPKGDTVGCVNTYWLVDPSAETEKRCMTIVRTGEPLPAHAMFLATIVTGAHLVEVPETFATA